MKSMAKGAVSALVAAVVLLLATAPAAQGPQWYYGYANPGCEGRYYLITTNLATVHSDAAAGRLKSYKTASDPCINMSIAGAG